MKVDFCTFCHKGDVHRLHAPGQLKRQVESNRYSFSRVIVVYQGADIQRQSYFGFPITNITIHNIDASLKMAGIDTDKPQYASQTDKAHHWKYHVVNHLVVMQSYNDNSECSSPADYIVFADNDCWMVRQPPGKSWIGKGIEILRNDPHIFIVSPNDGEPARITQRMSQQMFLARANEFRNADFNQPGWDGNVNISGGPMPEYWAMLEGRMELYCRMTKQYRYVLGPEYRYWHHNKLTEDDLFETDMSKY